VESGDRAREHDAHDAGLQPQAEAGSSPRSAAIEGEHGQEAQGDVQDHLHDGTHAEVESQGQQSAPGAQVHEPEAFDRRRAGPRAQGQEGGVPEEGQAGQELTRGEAAFVRVRRRRGRGQERAPA
jgi:hypothetical protein